MVYILKDVIFHRLEIDRLTLHNYLHKSDMLISLFSKRF